MKQNGFTLMELLVVIFITGLLSTIVAVNFSHQRNQQELQNGSQEMISKIREIQNATVTGKVVASGQAADAYEITFNAAAQSYTVDYFLDSTRTRLETITLSQNIETKQLFSGNSLTNLSATSPVVLRFDAPFGKIKVNGNANWSGRIELGHTKAGLTKSIVVDGISGRVGSQ